MSPGTELTEVELPLIRQLVGLGWQHVTGSKDTPSVTERESFREVLLTARLRSAIRNLNPGPDDAPWLDEDRISEAASRLQRLEATRLVEANQEVTQLLLEGTTVTGLPDWQGGRAQRVRYIDWDHPDHNDFLVINQFRVDEPGGQAKKFVVPDAVLFVNGIPLVVIECKSPGITEPMAEAITQLRRYANQRRLGLPEGNEQLFWTNQFVVGTHYDHAHVGTFTADPDQYLEWKDAAPLSKEELAIAGQVRSRHR